MRIGLSAYNLSAPDVLALAQDADAAGFDILWLGEHILAPKGYETSHPRSSAAFQQHSFPHADPSVKLVDPLVTLGAAGAVTNQIHLATGVFVAPLRHPLMVARTVATAQEVCGGRLVLGLGAGWLEEEFAALDVPFKGRFRRLEEGVEILRDALAGGWVERDSADYAFAPVQITQAPVPVPVVMGGNSPAAIRRAVRMADGWFSSGTPTLEEALALRELLRSESEAAGRTTPLRTWFRVPGADPVNLSRWADEGFEDVVVWANQVWPEAATDRAAVIAQHARALGINPS
ncbi:TIGR03619 family F420-dependent LLM class oxidoreductase [Nocardioides sp. AE5]|uniref:TIGR03619 family F420-dependent LLM class oxidoreductase n=1 Tax=Nocardioides sp. AE5 TaxID=2962573 RepID=UPI002880FDE0|nr:TIGR03619 family F420-dependent LLM class oxidoreductase [Nocardioides sp. AE5]MDT0202699.1 TIGR03619 family F420-dependent LLM class oxidoreductase [Nocardioides sp. AE5]